MRVVRISALGLVTFCAAAQCGASEPLWVDNLAPLTGLLGIPNQRNAEVQRGWMLSLNGAIASHFLVDQ